MVALADRLLQISPGLINNDLVELTGIDLTVGVSDDYYAREFIFISSPDAGQYPQTVVLRNPSTQFAVKLVLELLHGDNLMDPDDIEYRSKVSYGTNINTRCAAPIIKRAKKASALVPLLNKKIVNLKKEGYYILVANGVNIRYE